MLKELRPALIMLLLFTVITLNAVAFVALLVRWGYFPVATG